MLRKLPATARRLGGAFSIVLALFAAALFVMLRTLDQLETAEREVATLEEAKHAGHYAASFVREQYIHQAHTIIDGNDSHIGHYGEAVRNTDRGVRRLVGLARTSKQREWATAIAELAHASDTEFRELIVPAVLASDTATVRELHGRLETLVTRVVEINDRLNRDLESFVDRARDREVDLRVYAKNVVITCFSLAIAVSTIVGVLIMKSLLRPIALLRARAAEISRGLFDTKIEIDSDDEFGELGVAMNQMAVSLAERERDLVQSRTLATVGRMAATVAHEVNNPLSVILGYTRILQKQAGLDTEQAEGLAIIESETQQCRRIVDELLDLTRPLKLECADVDLVQIAEGAVKRARDAGICDGIRILGPDASGEARVWGDEMKLGQVVSNLMANAAEATPPGGEVSIAVEREGENVKLTIADSGEGITSDVLPFVFGPFFTTKPKGTGLGLAICQAIAQAHGGMIELTSQVKRGTSVTLSLPCRAAEAGDTL